MLDTFFLFNVTIKFEFHILCMNTNLIGFKLNQYAQNSLGLFLLWNNCIVALLLIRKTCIVAVSFIPN